MTSPTKIVYPRPGFTSITPKAATNIKTTTIIGSHKFSATFLDIFFSRFISFSQLGNIHCFQLTCKPSMWPAAEQQPL